jgi:hypothetical protein
MKCIKINESSTHYVVGLKQPILEASKWYFEDRLEPYDVEPIKYNGKYFYVHTNGNHTFDYSTLMPPVKVMKQIEDAAYFHQLIALPNPRDDIRIYTKL